MKVEMKGSWWDVVTGKMTVCALVDVKVVKRGRLMGKELVARKDYWWDLAWGETVGGVWAVQLGKQTAEKIVV